MANQVLDECESTNTYLKKCGEEGAPHGTWISARVQTAGRGRMGRVWEASLGNLYLSVLVRLSESTSITWIPLLTAVSVAETILKLKPDSPVAIKWPNDLVIARGGSLQKAGGILCEGVGQKGSSFVVVGIGLNCQEAPAVDQPTASLGMDCDLLRPLLIQDLLAQYRDGEFDPQDIQRRFMERSIIQAGDPLEWTDQKGHLLSGEFLGLGKLGELCVKIGKETRSLYSEEIKLKPIRPKDV